MFKSFILNSICEMKKIVLISRDNINKWPPIISYLESFAALNYETICICSDKAENFNINNVSFRMVGYGSNKNIFIKIFNYFMFGLKVRNEINDIGINGNTVFWVTKIDTALSLWSLLKPYNATLVLLELHDKFPIWKYITKKVIHNYNNVVYNEINRANIGRVWYKLKYTPSVIPNKPQKHPLIKNIKLNDENLYKIILDLKKTKRIILYQGSLLYDRNIEPLIKASLKLNDNFVLVLMGKDTDDRIESFKKINPSIVHIPWVTPPDHLYITSHAYIGIAFYDYDCLNSIYCAPNKIWEYSGFGIPMIGQDIPGLINTIGNNKAGLCVDVENEREIVSAIINIQNNYKEYENNAINFYNSVNFGELVKKAVRTNIRL